MIKQGARSASERWFRLLLLAYPSHFRDEMGEALVEAYLDQRRNAAANGRVAVATLGARALVDCLYNGIAERVRPGISWRRTGNWGRDMERAVKRLVRTPLFTLSVLGTMVIGLGAFAVVFAVVNGILIQPVPYERPDDLYFVWRDYNGLIDLKRGWVSGPDVADLGNAGGPIEAAAGIRRQRQTLAVGPTRGGDPEEVNVMISTANLFNVLGRQPAIGRGFSPGDGDPQRAPVVVLGHDLWQRVFEARASTLGTTLVLNGVSHEIIGVMGPEFHFVRHSSLGPPEGADVYTTFDQDLATLDPRGGGYAALIRAKAGSSPWPVTERTPRPLTGGPASPNTLQLEITCGV